MQPTASREIVGFLKVVGGALAAADGHPVGPQQILALEGVWKLV
jgi:hypothetical protein